MQKMGSIHSRQTTLGRGRPATARSTARTRSWSSSDQPLARVDEVQHLRHAAKPVEDPVERAGRQRNHLPPLEPRRRAGPSMDRVGRRRVPAEAASREVGTLSGF